MSRRDEPYAGCGGTHLFPDGEYDLLFAHRLSVLRWGRAMNEYTAATLAETRRALDRAIETKPLVCEIDATTARSVGEELDVVRKTAQDRLQAHPDVMLVHGIDRETGRPIPGWAVVHDDPEPTDAVDRGRGIETDGGRWEPTEPVGLEEYVALDMANNIDDERVKARISWVDGFGRAYGDALGLEELENNGPDRDDVDRGDGIETDGGTVTARVPELPDFQRDILLILARSGPTYGQGLVDDLGELRDETINHGRLYPNLDKLAGAGLVEKQIRVTDGRTNEYQLTPAGRAALREHGRRVDEAVEALGCDS